MATTTAHDCLDCSAALLTDEPLIEGNEVTLTCESCESEFEAVYEDHALVIKG